MRWLVIGLALLAVVADCIPAPAPEKLKPSVSSVRVRALAVANEVIVDTDDHRWMAFLLFENTSNEPVRYFRQEDECGLGLGKLSVLAGDKPVGSRATRHREIPVKQDLRELKPGEGTVVFVPHYRLYHEGKPGRYTLRVSYDLDPNSGFVTELGATPMSWKLRVPVVYK